MINLPLSWCLTPIERIIESLNYGTSKKCSYDTNGVPVLRIPNIGNGIIEQSNLKYADLTEKEFEQLRLTPGDILVIRSNGSVSLVGKSAVVRESERDFAYAGYLIRLRPNDFLLDSNYLNLCLSSHKVRLQIEVPAKSTSGVHNINSQELKQIKVPLPPLNEQRRIVAKIEALKARSQRVKEELEAIPALLDQFRQSVLAAAFRGDLTADWREKNPDFEPASVLLERIRAERRRRWEEAELEKMKAQGKTPKDDKWKKKYKEPVKPDVSRLPELPEGWIWASWDEVSNWVTYGFTRPMPHVEDGIPIVTAKNVLNNKIDINATHKTTQEAFVSLSDKDRPQPRDILITKDGTIGRAAIVTQEGLFCINQSVAVVWLRSCPINRKYLLAVIESPLTQKPIWENVRGNAIQHLSITDFAKMAFPLPPLQEQDVIVEQLARSLSTTENLAQAVEQNLKQIESLNQSILAKAFRGELVPQDPNDEPASVLLERIRAERERLDTKKKAKGKTEKKSRKAKPEPAGPEQLSLPGFE